MHRIDYFDPRDEDPSPEEPYPFHNPCLTLTLPIKESTNPFPSLETLYVKYETHLDDDVLFSSTGTYSHEKATFSQSFIDSFLIHQNI